MASGETNLKTLLATMEPTLDDVPYVFVTTKKPLASLPLETLNPQLIAQEAEGLTIVTTLQSASLSGLKEFTFPCRKISLTIHSSLEAVGLIAAIANRLKDHSISTNVVAGFYHDHIYVPEGRQEDAMRVLLELAEESKQ